jgi:hypothetical protein
MHRHTVEEFQLDQRIVQSQIRLKGLNREASEDAIDWGLGG